MGSNSYPQSIIAVFLRLPQRRRLTWENLPIDFLKLMPKRGDDQFLDVRSCDAGDATGFVLALLQHRLRDVVAIAHALLDVIFKCQDRTWRTGEPTLLMRQPSSVPRVTREIARADGGAMVVGPCSRHRHRGAA